MATEVTKTVELTLLNGRKLELEPLRLKSLRKFMKTWADHIDYLQSLRDLAPEERPSESELTDKQFDVYLDLAELGLERLLKDDDDVTNLREYIEDEIDEKSLYIILEATGGLKLGQDDDPNTQAGVQTN